MRRKTMDPQGVVNAYADAAARYGRGADTGKAAECNRQHEELTRLRVEIGRLGGDAETNFLGLLSDKDPWIRSLAAAHALDLDSERAEQVLDAVGVLRGFVGFDAKQVVESWRRGTLSFPYQRLLSEPDLGNDAAAPEEERGLAKVRSQRRQALEEAVLEFHGLAYNGGFLHAIECTEAKALKQCRRGYSSAGLTQVVELIDSTARKLRRELSDEEGDELEEQTDSTYYDAVPSDEFLLLRLQDLDR